MPPFTAFRIKPEFKKPAEIIHEYEQLESIPISVGRKMVGRLYVQRSLPSEPKWVSFFKKQQKVADLDLTNASASAVFLVQTKKGLFAVTFGHGRYLLEDGVVEPRFGLRATLNAVEPEKLRSIDHKRLDAVPRMTREQLSKGAGIDQFGLNVERDMLRAITGSPKDSSLGTVLAGADQLAFTMKIQLEELAGALEVFAELAERRDYRKHFSWVDNIQEVGDAQLRERLDSALLKRVRKNDASVWLAAPEIIDWNDLGGFAFSVDKSEEVFEDLNLSDYLGLFARRNAITLDRLRGDKVRLLDSSDDAVRSSWSLMKCLSAEVPIGSEHFVLSEGKWYRIDQTFLSNVDGVVSSLPRTRAPLLAWQPNEDEPTYLKRVGSDTGDEFTFLDRQNIRLAGRSAIEPCDLYWKDRVFVHVKRYGASSQLSHLFSQGNVSASLFHSEPAFRRQLHDKLRPDHRWGNPRDAVRPSDFEVAYAIMIGRKAELKLPFFSKVNLRNNAAQLQALGFRVSLTSISL
jgi:uncharacterized protein (TIGR04141 family)